MNAIAKKDLVKLLKNRLPDTSFINQLKIAYRPYICPFEQLLQLVPPQTSVFDIGCGSGMFLMLMAEFCSPQKLAGIEIRQDLIDNAQKLLETYQKPLFLSVFNGKEIPIEIAEYDCITMIDVLHHIPKNEQIHFLEQLYEKMKPEALFLFKDIDAEALPWVYFNKLHDLIFAREIGNEWKTKEFLDIAEKIGFKKLKLTKQRNFVYPHYTILLKK